MQQIRNQEEYIKFLEDYMFISESNRPVTGSSYKLPHLAESIRAYKAEREEVNPVVKIIILLFFVVLTSLMMGVAVIWCINEVVRFEVPFSLRNIAIISSLFFIGKAKLELFKKK